MSTLMSSRWATAEPVVKKESDAQIEASVATKNWADDVEEEQALPKVLKDESGSPEAPEPVNEEDMSAPSARGAEAVATEVAPVTLGEEKTFPNEDGVGEAKATATPAVDIVEAVAELKSDETSAEPDTVVPQTFYDIARQEPPRFKKRIPGKGRNIAINIPYIDFVAHGIPIPLSLEEVRERIQQFEEDGYATSTDVFSEVQMHNKSIYPEDINSKEWRKNNRPVVSLPNPNVWKNYMDAVMEAKLAALGVSVGNDEPPVLEILRQSPAPFLQTFSPPIPTTSAAGRPGFIRGHSHTMSVASPVSTFAAPFGHAHRHSTFSLTPMQAQELARQAQLTSLQSFSPQLPMAQVPSPAQFNALRNEFGLLRSGSPLAQSMTPVNGIGSQQLPQITQPPLPPNPFPLQRGFSQVPLLPELPEDEDEEELSDPTPYVPPQKRAHIQEEIVIPTPRGHKHNISEGLEREVMQTEQHADGSPLQSFAGRVNGFGHAAQLFGKISDQVPAEKDPLGGEVAVSQSSHTHKKSASRFNVAPPPFSFNPAATFQPGASAFNLPAKSAAPVAPGHTRQTSSGNFNVAAPVFKPSGRFNFSASINSVNSDTMPSSDFSFSTPGPVFDPSASLTSVKTDGTSGVFGSIDIPDIIKPAKKSKAIAIIHPSEQTASGTDVEDAEGRPERSDERTKRTRTRGGDDGDEVPRFAEPSPAPPMLQASVIPSQPADLFPITEEKPLPNLPQETEEDSAEREAVLEPIPKHSLSTSLSALAKPWRPSSLDAAIQSEQKEESSQSDASLEDGELAESAHEDQENAFTFPAVPKHRTQPSFAEIDAVMAHLNADADEQPWKNGRSISPIPEDSYAPQEGVQYIPAWPRSDAPSPSPRRKLASPPPFDHSGPLDLNGWSHINKLNKAQGPPSDWSDMLSPGEDHKLQMRSSFFDGRVDEAIGRVLADRLRPFEEALLNIQQSLNKSSPSLARQLSKQRSSSAIESDADDEEDFEAVQRPISRGRDQKLGQFKAVVIEALREQSPRRQQNYDIADLHSALADMKISFARVASTSLELDDVRAVVEEALGRQSQAVVPVPTETTPSEDHKREVAELENRLNETITGSLEQANIINQVEQREAEARRMLKLAEEELKLLREADQDEVSRVKALEEEHKRLVEQLDQAEDAQATAEALMKSMEAKHQADREASEADYEKLIDKLESKQQKEREDSEAEYEALTATLAEYRLSSDNWRKQVDEYLLERAELHTERAQLQASITTLERQLSETQDSGSSVRRRLEKLHADLATAIGQLTSEKGRWRTKEDSYRQQVEALETKASLLTQDKQQLEQELAVVREKIVNLDGAKQTLTSLQTSNAALDEQIIKLRIDLAEKQSIAARFEQESLEAKEAGRVEVQRMRSSLEMEVEAANNRVNIVRAELESEIAKLRAELDNHKLEADTDKEKHALLLEAEADTRRNAIQAEAGTRRDALEAMDAAHQATLQNVQFAHNETIEKLKQTGEAGFSALREQHARQLSQAETTIQDMTKQHARALAHAIEDKERSEFILNERLGLADAKLQHFQDKILHLEERVEVAKTAAQAAVVNAQGSRTMASPRSLLPEKVSPQALRESIVVLQEQLQDRETHIEELQRKIRKEGPAKIREKDTEISWLRELLAVRAEELGELINTLSKPTYDRNAVRDTAIRIRANLQMELQEKERFGQASALSSQAIASFSNFATPKLTSAFNKWRSSMESSALRSRPVSRTRPSATPSRSVSGSAKPGLPPSGLMTPPASNLRNSPVPEGAQPSLPGPKLTRRESQVRPIDLNEVANRSLEDNAEPATPTLLEKDDYDDDAEDRPTAVEEDEDLNIADSQPPAFRSLEDELAVDETTEAGAAEEREA